MSTTSESPHERIQGSEGPGGRPAPDEAPEESGEGRQTAGLLQEAARNKRLLGIAIVAAIGGFLFGYDTGVIGGALLFIQKDLNLDKGAQQAAVSAILVGAVVGAIGAGWLADHFSRRRTKILAGLVYVIGALGISGPIWRMTDEVLKTRAKQVQAAAGRLSAEFGAKG